LPADLAHMARRATASRCECESMNSDPGRGPCSFSAEFLCSIIDNLPLMVFVKDAAELRFELVNRAGEALLGHRREALIGRTDHDFFTKEQAEFFQAKDREAVASTGPIDVREEPISTLDGVRWLRTVKMAIRDDAGVARHLLGISEDITVKRDLEDKLRQVQKMDSMGKLAAGVAHDFNNLLCVILANAEVATGALQAGDPAKEELSQIAQAGSRAAELTRQLLAFAGARALPARSVDLNQVVRGMEKMLRRLLEANIQVTTVLEASSWPVCADPSALEQVLMNLVVNARDAMAQGGRLTIETANVEIDDAFAQGHPDATPGPHVMLAASDTGTGMDKATVARIFEPFFTTKPPGAGTGLGLWNVYGIVRQLGGTIWVYSEVGAGTTFKVYLPRARSCPPQARASDAPPAMAKRGSETVLVVEDEEQLLRVVSGVLLRCGYKVLGASSPAEALLLSEQHAGDIDLLLSDVIMPLLNGQQLADRLRRTRPGMKVAFMSGYTANAIDGHALLAPGFVLIQKPFSASTLLQQIRDVLGS
jgi:two-component system cell cycle sensor histidine kinase/response regulator CckA